MVIGSCGTYRIMKSAFHSGCLLKQQHSWIDHLLGREAASQSCIGNLAQIESAIQQWTLENKKPPGSKVAVENIAPYLKHAELPKCPMGGTYRLSDIDHPPTCSIADGHRI